MNMEWQQKYQHQQQQNDEPIYSLPSSRLPMIISISQAHNVLPVKTKSNTPMQQNGMTTTKYNELFALLCVHERTRTHTYIPNGCTILAMPISHIGVKLHFASVFFKKIVATTGHAAGQHR